MTRALCSVYPIPTSRLSPALSSGYWSSLSLRTEAELKEYWSTYYAPGATDLEIKALLAAYPADVTKGSPFDTGALNALTPQFKRLAALQVRSSFGSYLPRSHSEHRVILRSMPLAASYYKIGPASRRHGHSVSAPSLPSRTSTNNAMLQ